MRAGLVVLLTLCGAGVAAAQLCIGNAAFALTHVQIAANIAVDRVAQRYTGELRVGYRSIFAGGEAGVKTWVEQSLGGESNTYGATLGLDAPWARSSRFAICPFVSFASVSGPDQVVTPGGGVYNYSDKTFAGTISAGVLALRRHLWDVTPTAALSVGTDNPRLKARSGLTFASYQDICCGRQTWVFVRLGVGFGFSDSFTALPALALPLTSAGERTFGVLLAVRLGKGI